MRPHSQINNSVDKCFMFGKKPFKKIDCKRPSSTKQKNRVQNIQLKYPNRNITR